MATPSISHRSKDISVSLNFSEFYFLCDQLKVLEGHVLQTIIGSESHYLLGFYNKGEMNYLNISLAKQNPFFWLSEGMPALSFSKKNTPVLLFLKKHFLGKKCCQIVQEREWGRVLRVHFSNQKEVNYHIELQLIPHAPNILVFAGDKKISWSKPRPLAILNEEEQEGKEIRSLEEIGADLFRKTSMKPSTQKLSTQDIQKKEVARLEKLINKLQSDKEKLLKAKDEVEKQISQMYQSEKMFGESLNQAFKNKKNLERKIEGLEERCHQLQMEITSWENELSENFLFWKKTKERGKLSEALKAKDIRTKTYGVAGGHTLLVGKSAKDNLKLLREAKSWDYWFHIKDRPGSFGILKRQRNEEIGLEVLKKVAGDFLRYSLKSESLEVYEVLVAEVRYVRPIKGDKLGRVNYSHEKVLRLSQS